MNASQTKRLTGRIAAEHIKLMAVPRPPQGAVARLIALGDATGIISDTMDELGIAAGVIGASVLRPTIAGRTIQCLFLLLSALSTQHSAFAQQEVQWRHEYNSARKEAEEKQRPLMIDFGTENCFWCKRLDASTFRDPSVAALLSEKFIALKIDADREPMIHTMRGAGYVLKPAG